jgi:cytochrome P450
MLGSTYIPANTAVSIAHSCTHVSPTLYGPDPLSFRPTRWLSTSAGKQNQETLIEVPKGTFLAWSAGPRSCPGVKMAQVEFVAVMREIFAQWKVEAVGRAGDTPEMAKERLQAVVDDSQPRITLQMNRPRDVVLRSVQREEGI